MTLIKRFFRPSRNIVYFQSEVNRRVFGLATLWNNDLKFWEIVPPGVEATIYEGPEVEELWDLIGSELNGKKMIESEEG